MNRSLGFSCLQNARQLGGYRTADGRCVKENVLLRSGKLNCASAEEKNALDKIYHLQTVIDLRTKDERKAEPDPYILNSENIWIPVLNEDAYTDANLQEIAAFTKEYGDNPAAEAVAILQSGYDISIMYQQMLSDPYSMKQYAKFLRQLLLIHPGNSVLWHCSGGKDRAGTAAVLLLVALGADEQTILQDFDLSNHYYEKSIQQMRLDASRLTDDPVIIEKTGYFAGVNSEYMEKAMQWMKETYGSLHSYLTEALSINEAEIQMLKHLYTEILY